ncbi:UDP-glucose 4-epimerase [Liberibacter crescens BT-1]|uniref:UDP-glucose 4-epimerase n=1 Tax=Liberibacter crescens (strain BT-1) TaxID=1215343 RepID=L0EV93_LIBCB|nr:UDP-glucose 4-epimerase GalE [Liberibacter crescens]AGA64316.1 UDP-glucose 4-epimerase [Liberibacter crescens BT-1]AMC12529.1 UDP-glucose 4-epimerase [Liberibacter crescens]
MPNKTILVVGGAGYIGSHTCLRLAAKGFCPVVFDNLSSGHVESVLWGPFEYGDIRDPTCIREVFKKYKPVAILHFAALIDINASIKNPVLFYETNVIGSLNLMHAAKTENVKILIFSSTCATYGIPQQVLLNEEHPQIPINPYGRTKYIVEQIIHDHNDYCGLKSVILRYFNAAGADFESLIGEWHNPETHAIPLAIKATLNPKDVFKVFGYDYNTHDGTCLRDYIHVIDLADAHIMALEYLLNGGESTVLNLGTGIGSTVKELLISIEKISGCNVPTAYTERRSGDSPALVADNKKAKKILGWTPKYNLDDIVLSAWNWHKKLSYSKDVIF